MGIHGCGEPQIFQSPSHGAMSYWFEIDLEKRPRLFYGIVSVHKWVLSNFKYYNHITV